jgi:glutamate formiminotransferase/formiminotetrahydrofolate cyclodeaminase
MRVTGSELVGLVPLGAILDAGRYFLRKQGRSVGVPDHEIIKIAVKSLGLDELKPFEPKEKIIEYKLAALEPERSLLAEQTLTEFVESTAAESPAPGGGSVAAAVGALGSALGTMVANLSAHKRGWDERWEEFSDWAERGKALYAELLRLVDEDTAAFDGILASFRLPQSSEAERSERHRAIQQATKRAIEVPLQVMEASVRSMKVLEAMAQEGNPASVTDAGVGALCARAAARGAYMNMQINSGDLEDKRAVEDLLARGKALEEDAAALEVAILEIVSDKL